MVGQMPTAICVRVSRSIIPHFVDLTCLFSTFSTRLAAMLELLGGAGSRDRRDKCVEQRECRYISYLLRLWKTQDGTRSVWRASLEGPHSGECPGFAGLEQLCAFLKQQTIADGGSGGRPAEQKGKEGDAWDRG
jgi:hypothetical protein